MIKQIEINDDLQERVDGVRDEIKTLLETYQKENPHKGVPCLHNDLDYDGSIHELIDGAVPIHTKQQNDLWYLYGREAETAFENHGFEKDGEWPMGWQAAALYCLIEDHVNEWWADEAEAIWEELTEGSEVEA